MINRVKLLSEVVEHCPDIDKNKIPLVLDILVKNNLELIYKTGTSNKPYVKWKDLLRVRNLAKGLKRDSGHHIEAFKVKGERSQIDKRNQHIVDLEWASNFIDTECPELFIPFPSIKTNEGPMYVASEIAFSLGFSPSNYVKHWQDKNLPGFSKTLLGREVSDLGEIVFRTREELPIWCKDRSLTLLSPLRTASYIKELKAVPIAIKPTIESTPTPTKYTPKHPETNTLPSPKKLWETEANLQDRITLLATYNPLIRVTQELDIPYWDMEQKKERCLFLDLCIEDKDSIHIIELKLDRLTVEHVQEKFNKNYINVILENFRSNKNIKFTFASPYNSVESGALQAILKASSTHLDIRYTSVQSLCLDLIQDICKDKPEVSKWRYIRDLSTKFKDLLDCQPQEDVYKNYNRSLI